MRPILAIIFNKVFYNELLYVIRKGVNNEPTNNIKSATPSVTKILLNGERKLLNISIGKMISETNVALPGMVILCSIPQLSHLIGL